MSAIALTREVRGRSRPSLEGSVLRPRSILGATLRGSHRTAQRRCRESSHLRVTAWVVAMTKDASSQHLMHVDHDAVGVTGGGADEQVLHQPAVFFVTGLEFRHGAEIDQFG